MLSRVIERCRRSTRRSLTLRATRTTPFARDHVAEATGHHRAAASRGRLKPRYDSVSAGRRFKVTSRTRPNRFVLQFLCSNEPNNPPDKPAGFGCYHGCPRYSTKYGNPSRSYTTSFRQTVTILAVQTARRNPGAADRNVCPTFS